jgi:citronellol/citronellal dehydrogenase
MRAKERSRERPSAVMSVFRSPLTREAHAGSVALVTGGGSGIGRATAFELARTGARIAICGRRPDPLEATRADVEALGAECLTIPTDVREPDQVEALVAEVIARFGGIDILVHCAGGQFEAPAEEITLNGWRAVHRLNVDAVWHLTQVAATSSMIPRRKGVLVFVGFSPRRGIPGMAHSSAARAALENLAASLASEWSRFGIRAFCVAVGNVLTEGLTGYGAERVAKWEREVPLGRLGRPEEVATVIAFLASTGGGYVTGTTVVVDGGLDAWGLGERPPAVEP